MKLTLLTHNGMLELTPSSSGTFSATLPTPAQLTHARFLVKTEASRVNNLALIRRQLAIYNSHAVVTQMRDHEVIRTLDRQIALGQVQLSIQPRLPKVDYGVRTFKETSNQVSENIPNEPQAPVVENEGNWVMFRVLDEINNQPVSGVKLTLKMPDGSEIEKTTNSSGVVNLQNLENGSIDIVRMEHPEVIEVTAIQS